MHMRPSSDGKWRSPTLASAEKKGVLMRKAPSWMPATSRIWAGQQMARWGVRPAHARWVIARHSASASLATWSRGPL